MYHRQIPYPLLIILFLFLSQCSTARAGGWDDYRLKIDPNYSIVRANELDVVLYRNSGSIVLLPTDYTAVGPIVDYSVTSTYIFTCNMGRKPRNAFTGDTYEELDRSREFFFILQKGTDQLVGPLTKAQFQSRPEVVSNAPIAWKEPENPNIVLPILGSLMFLAVTAAIFGGPVLLLLLGCVMAYFLTRQRRRRRLARR